MDIFFVFIQKKGLDNIHLNVYHICIYNRCIKKCLGDNDESE